MEVILPYIGQAMTDIFSLNIIIFMFIGSIAGVIAAAIPGFTITMAVALTLPFTFGMTPIEGLATMIAVYVGGYSGGLISGILLGIPGTPASVPTVYDGHPMAKKGEPGRALSLGILSSFFGGLLGAIICIIFAIPLARFGLKFGPWEQFSLILFAMTMMCSLEGKNVIKGLMVGAFGLLLSTVGIDQVTAVVRFDFGSTRLVGGIEFLPMLIGFFALPKMMESVMDLKKEMLEKNAKTQVNLTLLQDIKIPWKNSLIEIKNQWINALRSGLIGSFVGGLPAAGGVTAVFLSYDQSKKFSKHSKEYGTGIADGIIASEAANSAVAGGSLIPTIALGIPGSAIAAILLGALILHGITPGPLLLRDRPVLVYGVFIALIISNFITLFVHWIAIRYFIKISQFRKEYLIPIVLVLCVVGTFALNNRPFDTFVFVFFGVIGYLLAGCKVPLAPAILGLILGPLAESNLRIALMTSRDVSLFFTRPLSLVFIILAIGSIVFSVYQMRKSEKEIKSTTSQK